MRNFFIRNMVRTVFSDDVCRALFAEEGIPEPSAGTMDRCRAAALSVGLAQPLDCDDKRLLFEIESAFVVTIQQQAAWYQRQWKALAA